MKRSTASHAPTTTDRAGARTRYPRYTLAPPRRMSGNERRWLDASSGLLKIFERTVDRIASRYVYPHLLGIWNPYSWQLPRPTKASVVSPQHRSAFSLAIRSRPG